MVQREAGAMHTSPIKVLVVDDMREIRTLVRRVLADAHAIQVAGEAVDGESAVQQALTLRPHIVVMDVQMPRVDGVEATRRIRELLPGTVVIGFSVRADDEILHRMRAAGAERVLPKERALELPHMIHGVMRHRLSM